MNTSLLVLSVLLIVLCAVVCSAFARPVCFTRAKVIKHYDGDTFKVQLDTGKIESIRIEDIDAPELKPPPGRYGKGQAWAVQSRSNLEAIIPIGSLVTLTCNTNRSWGRLPCTVTQGDVDVAEKMVETGFAFSQNGRYDFTETIAKVSKQGMWVDPPMLPKDYRKSF